MFWADLGEKCIIVQFLGMEKERKTGVLRLRKKKIRDLNAETQSTQRKPEGPDPGVKMRRRISFESTNLTGSSQDDGQFKIPGTAKSLISTHLDHRSA
jgi:hypothetical protein